MKPWQYLIASAAILIGISACSPVSTQLPTVPVEQPEASPTVSSPAETEQPTAINTLPAQVPTALSTLIPATPTGINTTFPPAPTASSTPRPQTPTVTPPPPNPAYPLLTVPLQAIQVSADDGRRTVRITPQQVKLWVDKMNEIFAQASVRFLYDPAVDFATLKSTLLDDMSDDTDKNWLGEVDAGNRVAARYPGRVGIVFFIYGPGQGPTGSGFSFSNYNFVEMPGFDDTGVCGYQNIGILAHEVGHYFGLSHPFARRFAGFPMAELFLRAQVTTRIYLDCDGLSDTA